MPCVLIGPTEVENDRGKVTSFCSFVNKPFHKYEKISERLKDHLQNNYHCWAQERADVFVKVTQMPATAVIHQLERLVPILKNIVLVDG